MPTRVSNKKPISCAHREPHQLDNHKLVEQIDHDYHVDNSSSVASRLHQVGGHQAAHHVQAMAVGGGQVC